jgi:hypothetical protein
MWGEALILVICLCSLPGAASMMYMLRDAAALLNGVKDIYCEPTARAFATCGRSASFRDSRI